MLLKHCREAFDGARWLFKPKWDGWRCLAAVQDGRAMLLSRNGRDLTRGIPGVPQALSALPSGTVLDGELVILNAEGRPEFDTLMRRGCTCLVAFDLLRLDGRDVCAEPIEERKRRLADVVASLADPHLEHGRDRGRRPGAVRGGEGSRHGGGSSPSISAAPTLLAAAQLRGLRCGAMRRIGGTVSSAGSKSGGQLRLKRRLPSHSAAFSPPRSAYTCSAPDTCVHDYSDAEHKNSAAISGTALLANCGQAARRLLQPIMHTRNVR